MPRRENKARPWQSASVPASVAISKSIKKPHDPFYDTARWKHTRLMQLSRHPLCVTCESIGKLTGATVVDHIIPRSQGGDDYAPENLQSLCAKCHRRKTSKDYYKFKSK